MSALKFKIVSKKMSLIEPATIIAGEINETECIFEFDSTWDRTEKTAVFYTDTNEKAYALIKNNTCPIPWSKITKTGILYVGAFAVIGGVAWGTNVVPVYVHPGISPVHVNIPPTQNIYLHFIQMMNQQATDASIAVAKSDEAVASAASALSSKNSANSSESKAKASENIVVDIQTNLSSIKDAAVLATSNAVSAAINANNVANTYASQITQIVTISIKNFGAKGDGVTDDTMAIQNAINFVKKEYYDKGTAIILFPVPEKFYKISSTLDLTELWNVTIECPAQYSFQRQTISDVDNDYKLIHWYGGAAAMIKCDYSFSLEFKNISLNGRNTATVGFQLHPNEVKTSANKFINIHNCMAKYCVVGYDIGEVSQQTDDCPISLYSCIAYKNTDVGFKINSGNDCVKFFGGTAYANGETPVGITGTNIHIVSGEIGFFGFVTDGSPLTSDIKIDSGGLTCVDFWSDVSKGLFLIGSGSSITRMSLTSVRHYDANMTEANTPQSINYNGNAPLVLNSCYLYNDVNVDEGNQTQIISIGTQFVAPNATFTGTMITNQRSLVSIGKTDSNEARISIGKPSRVDGGQYKPFTQWGGNNRPLGIKTIDNYTITEGLQEGSRFYEMLGNAYNDNGAYKSISSGNVWRVKYQKNNAQFYTSSDATGADQTITWSLWAGFQDAIGSPNGNSALYLRTRKINWEASAPTIGTHTRGDIVYNQEPTPGGKVGWVCTASGAPGTWKPFGDINA